MVVRSGSATSGFEPNRESAFVAKREYIAHRVIPSFMSVSDDCERSYDLPVDVIGKSPWFALEIRDLRILPKVL
jgi:hypothetical protein